MSTPFAGYADPFAVTPGKTSAGEFTFDEFAQRLRKLKKKNKELKQTIKEQQLAEQQRLAEAKRIEEEKRAAKEAKKKKKKKERSLLERVGDAVVKAIPGVLLAVASFFLKGFFSRRK